MKGNTLLQRKRELELEEKNIENEILKLNESYNQLTQRTQRENDDCEAKKTQLKSEIEKEKLNQNQEIIMLRKLIAQNLNNIIQSNQINENNIIRKFKFYYY